VILIFSAVKIVSGSSQNCSLYQMQILA